MFFDVDTLMTVPLSCSMSFDEAGKPITRLCVVMLTPSLKQ